MEEILSQNSFFTKKIGENLAKKIIKKRKKEKQALILALKGDLGSGKTIFLKGFAHGLGIKEKIQSPTFIIMKSFKLFLKKFKRFYHFDCYRINKPREILKLGFRKIIKDPKNIVAIEWAEKIRKILPKNVIWIEFDLVNKTKRRIKINL